MSLLWTLKGVRFAAENARDAAPARSAAPRSDLGRLLGGFTDATLLLTFREEGLHAVVTIDRKKAR
jgi:hypothetical protein